MTMILPSCVRAFVCMGVREFVSVSLCACLRAFVCVCATEFVCVRVCTCVYVC